MQHSRTSRRQFVKQAALAGAGALAVPQVIPSGLLGANAPSKRLNIGMLSCGDRSRQLLGSILGPGENIVALCDVSTEQISRLIKDAARHGQNGAAVEKAKVYEDYRKLLEAEKSVDAVVVAPGQRWHVPMCKAALLAGKHVFCEKPLAHSVAETREIEELGKQTKLATQIGSQGGASETFRRSMEVIQAGVLGAVREVHTWITRSFPPSAEIDRNADPIPSGLNWDFWCGPSQLLPFKRYYLGGCLAWGRWLEFGDGHLADMGAHAHNLPWRALKLTRPISCRCEHPEPLKDSYPSANKFCWEFPARGDLPPVTLWWHDGAKAGPPEPLASQLAATYNRVPGDGVLFVGEKGLLFANAWGVGGTIKMAGEEKFRGVLNHEAAKSVPVTLPRAPGQDHMREWLDACKGEGKTFQGFDTAAPICEIAMVGIVALRLGKPVQWDSASMKVKDAPEAEVLVHRPQRKKWL